MRMIWCYFHHRVDSVIESLGEIIGSKNFALINFSLNLCETTIYDNKVFLENLVAVHSLYMKLLRMYTNVQPVIVYISVAF